MIVIFKIQFVIQNIHVHNFWGLNLIFGMDLFSFVPKSSSVSSYYFGTSDLAYVSPKGLLRLIKKRYIESISEKTHNRTKTTILKRNTLSPTHHLINYKGTYFEWGATRETNKGLFGLLNDAKSNSIRPSLPIKGGGGWMMETVLSGYSSVSLECIMACTTNYRTLTGDYSLINNNCHHFANTISMVLCSNICPDWCTRML